MSSGTGRQYPLTMICVVWRVSRSTAYAENGRQRLEEPVKVRKRGPKTELSDEELLEEIREVLQNSDFLAESHRMVRARLRKKGIRVGKTGCCG